VTALAGPLAASVVERVAALVAELAHEFCDDAGAAQAESLRLRAAALVQADSSAYAQASLRLIDRDGHDFELGRALDEAAVVPLRIAETAADVAELAAALVDRVVPEARADLAGAALLAEGAARAASHLVEVNLAVSTSDERLRRARAAADAAGAAARGYTSKESPS
jgi:formiminotetrahydrofolate cyclodeaminase